MMHDLTEEERELAAMVREFADTVIGLRSGEIVLRGRADEVPAEEITGLYTPVTNSESK